MAVILVDMDDVLAQFEAGFLDIWRRLYPDLPYIPLPQRDVFGIEKQYPPEFREKIRAIFRTPGFFLNLEPVPGGPEALRQMLDQGHQVFICTAPMVECVSCSMEKFQWTERHLGHDFLKRLTIASDKTLVRGDFLIDDRPEVTGSMAPVWEHVVFDCAYNRSQITKRRLAFWPDWRRILGL